MTPCPACVVTVTVDQRQVIAGLKCTPSATGPARGWSDAGSSGASSADSLRRVLSWEHGWGYTTFSRCSVSQAPVPFSLVERSCDGSVRGSYERTGCGSRCRVRCQRRRGGSISCGRGCQRRKTELAERSVLASTRWRSSSRGGASSSKKREKRGGHQGQRVFCAGRYG